MSWRKAECVQENNKSYEKETEWLRYGKMTHTSFYLGHSLKLYEYKHIPH